MNDDSPELSKGYATAEDARAFCWQAHEGQVDKGGEPYYLHPFAVADRVEGDDERTVAYLHDVVEDTAYTLEDLRQRGYSPQVVAAVDALTLRAGETYDDYLLRVKADPIARVVKLADLSHNLDPERSANITCAKRAQYERAVRFLMS